MSTPRVVNALKKREAAFRADLWAAIKSVMENKENEKLVCCGMRQLVQGVPKAVIRYFLSDSLALIPHDLIQLIWIGCKWFLLNCLVHVESRKSHSVLFGLYYDTDNLPKVLHCMLLPDGCGSGPFCPSAVMVSKAVTWMLCCYLAATGYLLFLTILPFNIDDLD
ncbi:hypothetical protein LXL04_020434 [Taraxacum kok-saghyz]